MLSVISVEHVVGKIYRVWFDNNDGVVLLEYPLEMSVKDWRKFKEAVRTRKPFKSRDKLVIIGDSRMLVVKRPIEGSERLLKWGQLVAANTEVLCDAAQKVLDLVKL